MYNDFDDPDQYMDINDEFYGNLDEVPSPSQPHILNHHLSRTPGVSIQRSRSPTPASAYESKRSGSSTSRRPTPRSYNYRSEVSRISIVLRRGHIRSCDMTTTNTEKSRS